MADDSLHQTDPVHLKHEVGGKAWKSADLKEVVIINCLLTKIKNPSECAYLVGSNIRGPTRPWTDRSAVAAVTDLQNGTESR